MKKKVVLIPLLAAAVTAVWVFNISLLAGIGSQVQKNPAEDDMNIVYWDTSHAESNEVSFKPVKRDPFNVFVDTTPREPPMPKLSLRGVVLTSKGALALMELPDGSISTMKKGDTYGGVTIEDITAREVVTRFRSKQFIFAIWK